MSTKALSGTLAEAIWTTTSGRRARMRNLVLAVCGSLFVAICAQVQVPMWPVPVTMQTFAVMAIGMAFGARLGAMTLALYMAEGAVGLPVFAGFAGGPGVILGPTGGYIVGFVLAAWLIGRLAERGWDRKLWSATAANLAGTVMLYVPGLLWLAYFYWLTSTLSVAETGADTVLGAVVATGLTPFLLGAALKIALASALVCAGWSVLNRLRA